MRKQVWELLAALSVYGRGEGLRRALSTLEQLATLKGQRSRLAPLAQALAEGPADEAPALLTLANRALNGRERSRLRAELRARGAQVPPGLVLKPAEVSDSTKDHDANTVSH